MKDSKKKKRLIDKLKGFSFKRKAFELQMSHLAIMVVGSGLIAWLVYLVISWNNARQNEMMLKKPINEARFDIRKMSDDDQAELAEVVKKLSTDPEISQEELNTLKNPDSMTIYIQDRWPSIWVDINFDGSGGNGDYAQSFCDGYVKAMERQWLKQTKWSDTCQWENEVRNIRYSR